MIRASSIKVTSFESPFLYFHYFPFFIISYTLSGCNCGGKIYDIDGPVPDGIIFFVANMPTGSRWCVFWFYSGRMDVLLRPIGATRPFFICSGLPNQCDPAFLFFPGPSYNQIVIRTAPEKQVAGRRDEGRLFRWNNGGRHAFFPQRCGGVQKGLAKIR
jgi:hypothetical protein